MSPGVSRCRGCRAVSGGVEAVSRQCRLTPVSVCRAVSGCSVGVVSGLLDSGEARPVSRCQAVSECRSVGVSGCRTVVEVSECRCTTASDRGRCKRGPSCPYISAQSPSPRMFLKNLRQRIVQYYIKIEPCHAKVFRPTMVQRHIRDRANADSAVCTPKHQTMLYMSAQSPSPWTFLTNLRQRIVQNYTKIEPGYAKVFRQTTVQRHIRVAAQFRAHSPCFE